MAITKAEMESNANQIADIINKARAKFQPDTAQQIALQKALATLKLGLQYLEGGAGLEGQKK